MAMILRYVTARFSAGHRVLGSNTCGHIHGHDYTVRMRLMSRLPESQVDGIGEVPLANLGSSLQAYCNTALHGKFLVSNEDDLNFGAFGTEMVGLNYNPTLENLARFFGEVVGPFLPFANACYVAAVEISSADEQATWVYEIDD